MIEHANIIFMPNISALGGIETYVYELVKKYYYLDIAVVCNRIHPTQEERIRKYCKVYKHNGEMINCKVAIINYNQEIIKYINKDAKIYQTIHADYTNEAIYLGRYPHPNKRITAFLGITKYLVDNLANKLKPNKIELCYNPLTIDDEKPIIIVSATRLHQNKGADLMQKLINKMDKENIYYLWFVLTGDSGAVKGKNIIEIPPRLDVDKFLSIATYVCLCSRSEACSYTQCEALFRNIPLITTQLPYLEEIGFKDGVNGFIINDNNIDEVVKKMVNPPSFKFKRFEDNYKNIFADSKSRYEEEKLMKVKVKCIKNYYDIEEDERKVYSLDVAYENPSKHPNRNEWITTRERADHLVSKGLVEIVEVIQEEKKENKKKPTKKVEKK